MMQRVKRLYCMHLDNIRQNGRLNKHLFEIHFLPLIYCSDVLKVSLLCCHIFITLKSFKVRTLKAFWHVGLVLLRHTKQNMLRICRQIASGCGNRWMDYSFFLNLPVTMFYSLMILIQTNWCSFKAHGFALFKL